MATNEAKQTEYRAKFAEYDASTKQIIVKDLVADIKSFSEYVFAGKDREGFISRAEAARKLKAVSRLLGALTDDMAA